MNNLEAHTFAYRFAKCLEEWTQKTLFKDFTLEVKLDWSPRRISSRGGIYKAGPGINIAMIPAFPNNHGKHPYRFYEYPSYDADKDIGGFYAIDPYLKLKAIVAHEVAHAIQMYSYTITKSRCTPHGPVFKSFYKMLRQRFINPDLPNQVNLEKDYNQYLLSLTTKNNNQKDRQLNLPV
jgi:hypothetical protein